MGDSRKYPYSTTGGIHEHFNPPPPCFQKFQNALPHMPSEFQNRLPLLPSGISDFFFSDSLEFLFDCLKLPLNGKLALFPPPRKFCLQFLVRQRSNSSLLTFSKVHHRFAFYVLSNLLTTKKNCLFLVH